MLVSAFFFTCIILFAGAFFVRSVRTALKPPLQLGRPEHRTNRIAARLRRVLDAVFLPTDRLRLFLLGCLLIALTAVIESFAEGMTDAVSPFRVLGPAYPIVTFLQEASSAVLIAVVLGLLVRRWIVRPRSISRLQSPMLLSMILMIAVTIVGVDALRISAGVQEAGWAYPLSSLIARALGTLPAAPLLMHAAWAAHILCVLAFFYLLSVPSNIQILASLPNLFFAKMEERGMLPPYRASRDGAAHMTGAIDATDLTWKSLLDGYACLECGRCDAACPAHEAGLPLSPQQIITGIRHRTDERFRQSAEAKRKGASGDGSLIGSVLHGRIAGDALWSCTTCMACVDACPVSVEHVDTIVEFRRGLVARGADIPSTLADVFRRIEEHGSPYPEAASQSRCEWAEGLGIPTLAEQPRHDLLFWVGCAGAFDARCRSISSSFARLLQHAGVRFAILGDEERCTGDAARRLGNEKLARALMQHNIDILKRYRVKTIVTTCPHCYNTLKNEYPVFGGRFSVLHHTQYLDQLLRSGALITTHTSTEPVLYHDPCYLARGNRIVDEPRRILRTVSVARPAELEHAKERTLCCGAGGGRMWMDGHADAPIITRFSAQMREANCGSIATACPFCLTSISAGLPASARSGYPIVRDVAELLYEAIDTHVKVSPFIHSK